MKKQSTGEQLSTSPSGRVLVVDDFRHSRESIADTLRAGGHTVACAASASEALRMLADDSYDLIFTDLQMPGMSGLEFLAALEQKPHGAQIVMVTAHATVASAVEAMRRGAFDYIEKPFQVEQLEAVANRALEHGRALDANCRLSTASHPAAAAMIGNSAAMQSLRTRISQVACTNETVLILGESGTGKELVARAVHMGSERATKPLIGLNCPALSAHLMESELFGHEKGAFTGADAPRTGRFELADGGTILLDEVTEIELPLQAKLLRVLQERTFERVGSSITLSVDVRVIATSNRQLQSEVAAGRFREDLYYRLAVVPLEVPPLRERAGDVPQLVEHFLARAAGRLHRTPCRLEAAALELLCGYHWPGNVRELENIISRASVLNVGAPVTAAELRPWLIDAPALQGDDDEIALPHGASLEEMERRLIEATLERFAGHRAKTADALGIGLRTLSGKLKQYGYAPRARSLLKAG